MNITQLSPSVFVGAQIRPGDLQTLADAEFTDIVCNRPDSEHPNDPGATKLETQAGKLGLAFHYAPIAPDQPFDQQAETLATLAMRPGAKVFAYCRSGARSSKAWSLAQSMTPIAAP